MKCGSSHAPRVRSAWSPSTSHLASLNLTSLHLPTVSCPWTTSRTVCRDLRVLINYCPVPVIIESSQCWAAPPHSQSDYILLRIGQSSQYIPGRLLPLLWTGEEFVPDRSSVCFCVRKTMLVLLSISALHSTHQLSFLEDAALKHAETPRRNAQR